MRPNNRPTPGIIFAWFPFYRRGDRPRRRAGDPLRPQLPPFTRHSQFTDNAYVRGQTTFISPQVNGYITAVNVKDFAIVQPGEVLFQIDDRIYKQRVHQAQATPAMKERRAAQ